MIRQKLSDGGHKWEKQNLLTLDSPKGGYDLYKCSQCGIEGRSYKLGYIDIPERFAHKANECRGIARTGSVKVTCCQAQGPQFRNLTPGSVHDVVEPPQGESNKGGVWVMGVGEPVKLLYGEFNYIEK